MLNVSIIGLLFAVTLAAVRAGFLMVSVVVPEVLGFAFLGSPPDLRLDNPQH